MKTLESSTGKFFDKLKKATKGGTVGGVASIYSCYT